MRMNLKELWTYFRMGFATYTSRPMAVFNMILLLALSISDSIHWIVIAFIGVAVILISILFGYLHYRKTGIYETDQWINVEQSPIAVARIVFEFEVLISLYNMQDLPIPEGLNQFHEYFLAIYKNHNYERIYRRVNHG